MLEEKDWLSMAKDDLISIQSFNQFERGRMNRDLEMALIAPDKNKKYDFVFNAPADEADTGGGFLGIF
jgi:hypothetical protein